MSNKAFGNPLTQAIQEGTIGKKTEPKVQPTITLEETPVRKVGRKPTKKDRVQHTIYLPPELSKWVKIDSYEERREISEIVNDALLMYKESKERSQRD